MCGYLQEALFYQMWKLVKAKREELAAVGKNNLQYAIRGVKEYRKILLEEDVVGFLRHLDRPRLIRPRYGEQLAKAFLPMLKITQVKGKGQKLDIKFKQEPFPKMSMLTKSKKVYLTIVISQDDAGGLRVSAVSEDDEVYKCWFMYQIFSMHSNGRAKKTKPRRQKETNVIAMTRTILH